MKLDAIKEAIKVQLAGQKPRQDFTCTISDNGKPIAVSFSRSVTGTIFDGNMKDPQETFYFNVQGMNEEVEITL